MSKYSAIDTLECIVDGDTIVPGMNYVLPTGIGTTQYYNPTTGKPTPDYTQSANQITIYPACYSSGQGKFVVPTTGAWYIDNPESASAQIATTNGTVGTLKPAYNGKYETTTVTLNPGTALAVTVPALKIKSNFASAMSLNDVKIYYVGTFNGIEVRCHADFSVKETTGSNFDVVVNCESNPLGNVSNGWVSGDTVISDGAECLRLTPTLTLNGSTANIVAGNVTYSWMKVTSSGLTPVTHVAGVTEISGNKLVLFDGGVEGTEEYVAVATYNGNTYRKAVQVSDTHDPYFINIGRSTPSNLVKEGETVTYNPTVVDRNAPNTPLNGWTFQFTCFQSDGSAATVNGNSTWPVTATSFSVSGADVRANTGFNVLITANHP